MLHRLIKRLSNPYMYWIRYMYSEIMYLHKLQRGYHKYPFIWESYVDDPILLDPMIQQLVYVLCHKLKYAS